MRLGLGLSFLLRTQAPHIPLHHRFEANLAFFELGKRRRPDHAKFCPMLLVLHGQLRAHFEIPPHRAQTSSGVGNIQSVGELGIAISRAVLA